MLLKGHEGVLEVGLTYHHQERLIVGGFRLQSLSQGSMA